MSQPRSSVIALVCAIVMIAAGAWGQSAKRRAILSDIAPPPIQRGIIRDFTHAPDSPETVRRSSIRPLRNTVDRIGVSGARYAPGRVIVKYKDGTAAAARLSAMSAARATASERSPYADFDVLRVDPAADPEAVAEALGAQPNVEYAQAAYRMHTMLVPNDKFYPQQWNLPLIDMERAWDIQPQAGSQITVAIVDTGVAFTTATVHFHADAFTDDSGTPYPALGDLALQFVPASELFTTGRFVAPHDFIWDDDMPLDLDGHGTHVSGTVGQLTNNATSGAGDQANGGGAAGVAFGVKLMPVKVIDGRWDDIFGSPNVGTDDIVALGVRYAADNGAKVINMSIGRSGPPAPVLEDAIRYAVGKGAFIAIAAGNDFENGNPTQVVAEIASRVQGAVSVAAVDPAKGHAYYSSTGSYVELSAPGGSFRGFGDGGEGGVLQQTLDLDLVDTFDLSPSRFIAPRFDSLAYFFFVGTSQATPHVSGVAAMLMQQGITDPAAIEAALEAFATPCDETRNTCDAGIAKNRNDTYGFGLIGARTSLRGWGVTR